MDVYPRGARFVFELTPTEDSFRFELPGAFDAASVRLLNLTGVSDLQVIEQGRKGWIPPSLAPLKELTDAQAKAVALLKAKAASLEQTRAMLNVSSAQVNGTESRDLIHYMEDAQALRLKVENDLADLTETLSLETEELERLKAELESRSPQRSDQIVQVSGRTNARQPLLFEARTDAARWGLRYVMDLNSATGAIDVHMFASAAQGGARSTRTPARSTTDNIGKLPLNIMMNGTSLIVRRDVREIGSENRPAGPRKVRRDGIP